MNNYLLNRRILLKIFMFFVMFFWFIWVGNAATITSTPEGGSWSSASTWEWWIVPWENDDVIVNWEVALFKWFTVNDLEVNGQLYNLNSDIYDLNIKWDVVNNWIIWWNFYWWSNNGKLRLNIDGSLTNNRLVYVYYTNVYWSIINNHNTTLAWSVTLLWEQPRSLVLNWSVTNNFAYPNVLKVDWDFIVDSIIYLGWKTIYFDGNNESYLNGVVWPWKILSLDWDWTNERIKIKSSLNFETDIELLETKLADWIIWKNITCIDDIHIKEWIIWNLLLNDCNIKFSGSHEYEWDLIIWTWSTLTFYDYSNNKSNVLVIWDLINYWKIWWDGTDYANLDVKWNIINYWDVSNFSTIYAYWDVFNKWSADYARLWVKWEDFNWYDEYIVELSDWTTEFSNSNFASLGSNFFNKKI